MKSMICAIVAVLVAAAQAQHPPMIPYSYGYQTADGMSRTESGNGNVVQGSYSYIDANGDNRQVRYIADAHGFRPEGDISVDRKTAAAAAALAAIAPKAPIAAPVAPQWNPTPVMAAPTFRSFNSFEQMKPFAPASFGPAPVAPVPTWAGSNPVSYQVETPTHKIWVKY